MARVTRRWWHLLLAALVAAASARRGSADHMDSDSTLQSGAYEWKPKTEGTYYNPKEKDWAGVISACRAVGKYEKRILSFWIRSTFHDGMAIDLKLCNNGHCPHGMDGSLYLTESEQNLDMDNPRWENEHEHFPIIGAMAAIKIAKLYDISVADTLAVCALSAIEQASSYRLKVFGPGSKYMVRVGRRDSLQPAPENTLPDPAAQPKEFAQWWEDRGFSVWEAAALMGTHSLIDDQECYKGPGPKDYCDNCPAEQLAMFKLDNHYYHDACSGTLNITELEEPQPYETTADEMKIGSKQWKEKIEDGMCTFSSKAFKRHYKQRVLAEHYGNVPVSPLEKMEKWIQVDWTNEKCESSPGSHCPHQEDWPYTKNDAYLGQVCQSRRAYKDRQLGELRSAYRAYLNQCTWDRDFVPAMIKLVSMYASWSTEEPVYITGQECPASGYELDKKCARAHKQKDKKAINCRACSSPSKANGKQNSAKKSPKLSSSCHKCCRCKSAYSKGYAMTVPNYPKLTPDMYNP